jgi:riboflavin biosynthesis pyrimidine reductase
MTVNNMGLSLVEFDSTVASASVVPSPSAAPIGLVGGESASLRQFVPPPVRVARVKPLELLYEESPPAGGLPVELAHLYGGGLEIPRRCVYANFVASLDGVVTLGQDAESGQTISGGSEADRFVMALLRAKADAVLVGAQTFRKAPGHRWTAETIFPELAACFAELRAGRAPPPLVVVSESGAIDVTQPALENALVVTSSAGEARLRSRLPDSTRLIVGPIALPGVFARLRELGFEAILTEGGPTLATQLVRERLLDQLFLTSAPSLFGRFDGDRRKSLMNGLDLAGVPVVLAGVRRHQSHLFLRYRLGS